VSKWYWWKTKYIAIICFFYHNSVVCHLHDVYSGQKQNISSDDLHLVTVVVPCILLQLRNISFLWLMFDCFRSIHDFMIVWKLMVVCLSFQKVCVAVSTYIVHGLNTFDSSKQFLIQIIVLILGATESLCFELCSCMNCSISIFEL
jgi:hypothetical protein